MITSGIAVAQFSPVARDVDANVQAHLCLAERAAAQGATCVVFPELSLTGYEIEAAPVLAFTGSDPRLGSLRTCSERLAIRLLVGAPLWIAGALHLSQLILSPDGSVGIYTKRRLGAFSESARRDGSIPPPEPSVFVPGTLDPQVELETGPAALAICADIGDPAHPQLASDAGAAHYLASMFVIPSELDADLARLSGYAQRFGWLVGFANFVGHSGGLAAAGSSAFWGPDGALLVQLPKGDAGLAMAWKSPEGWRGRRLD